MKKLFICLVVSFIVCFSVKAQDLHYSQFYMAPLTTNPAYTGFFDGDYRVGINFKNQWTGFTNGYNTFSAFGDVAVLRGRSSWVGLGVNAAGDRAGDGKLTTIKIGGSLAYHLSLLSDDQLLISAGFGGWMVQKSFDPTNLYFDSQWVGNGFDNVNLPNNENFATENISYTTVDVGLTITYTLSEVIDIYGSGSVVNLNRPEESFYNADPNTRELKMFYELGSNFYAGASTIEPGVLWKNEKGANEYLAGLNIAIGMGGLSYYDDAPKFIFGAWYRVADAFIPVVGAELFNTRALLSYDLNASELSAGSGGRGGFELSIIYIGETSPKRKIHCPKF